MHLDRAFAAQLSLNFIPLRVSETKEVLITGANIELPVRVYGVIYRNCARMTFRTDISRKTSRGTLPNTATAVDYFGDLNYLNIPIIMPGYCISRANPLRQLLQPDTFRRLLACPIVRNYRFPCILSFGLLPRISCET